MSTDVTYSGTGSQTDFTITFPYQSRDFVEVRVDGVLTSSYSFISDSVIRFNPAPAAGVSNIVISRNTSFTPLVDFVNGSALVESDLDKGTQQPLNAVEERFGVVDAMGPRLDDMEIRVDALVSGETVEGVTARTVILENNDVVIEADIDALEENTYTSPSTFGAVGDGVTDDTAAIQAAIESLDVGATLDGRGRLYLVKTLWLHSDMRMINFRLKLPPLALNDFSVINIGNDLATTVLDGYHNSPEGIAAEDASRHSPGISNIILDNIHIDGNRTNQTNITTRDGGRHGFCIKGYATNIKIHNSSANYCTTDGILIYRGLHTVSLAQQSSEELFAMTNIEIKGSTFNWNGRHGGAGDSIDDFLVEGCFWNYNGRDINGGVTEGDQGLIVNGLRYGNGFDMEGYLAGSRIRNITFRDCQAIQNVRDGILIFDVTDAADSRFLVRDGILITGCHLDAGTEHHNGYYALSFSSSIGTKANGPMYTNVVVSDCYLEGMCSFRAVDNVVVTGCNIVVPGPGTIMAVVDYATNVRYSGNNANVRGVAVSANESFEDLDYVLRGSAAWVPGTIPAGGKATVSVSCPGAQYGDYTQAAHTNQNVSSLAGLVLNSYVVFGAGGFVQVTLINTTAGDLTISAGTVKVRASRY